MDYIISESEYRRYLLVFRDYFTIIGCLTHFLNFQVFKECLVPELRRDIHPLKINADSKTLAMKFISILHSIICFIYNYLYIINYISYITWLKFIGYTISYIMFDSFLLITDNRLRLRDFRYIRNNKYIKEMLFHHFLMYIIIDYSYLNHSYILAQGLLCELSSIFLHITWIFLRIEPLQYVPMNISGVITVTTFFFSRVVNFTHIYTTSINYSNTPISVYIDLMVIIIIGMNYLWFYKLFNRMIKSIFN